MQWKTTRTSLAGLIKTCAIARASLRQFNARITRGRVYIYESLACTKVHHARACASTRERERETRRSVCYVSCERPSPPLCLPPPHHHPPSAPERIPRRASLIPHPSRGCSLGSLLSSVSVVLPVLRPELSFVAGVARERAAAPVTDAKYELCARLDSITGVSASKQIRFIGTRDAPPGLGRTRTSCVWSWPRLCPNSQSRESPPCGCMWHEHA